MDGELGVVTNYFQPDIESEKGFVKEAIANECGWARKKQFVDVVKLRL
jgi:hypothetical protein